MNTQDWQHIDAIGQQLQHIATTYGPTAWSYAQDIERINCIQGCVMTIAFVIVGGLGTGFLIPAFIRECCKGILDQELHVLFGGAIGGLISMVMLSAAVMNLFNFWMWVGVFNPTLALAHDAMVKVIGN